jgi:alpha-beta hydrolase superfamily lysophospholipase
MILSLLIFLIIFIVLAGLFMIRSSIEIQNKIIWPGAIDCTIHKNGRSYEKLQEVNPQNPNIHIIYFHGNAESTIFAVKRTTPLTSMYHVYCIEYPCYSDVCPVENLHPETFWPYITDTVNNLFLEIHKKPNQKIILYGRSIGTGVVGELLYREKYIRETTHKIILETPFTSLADILTDKVGQLLSDMFTDKLHWTLDNKTHFSEINITQPVLIFAGEKDSLTPLSHAKKLHQIIKTSSLIVKNYGHIIPFTELENDIDNFLSYQK